MEPLAPSFRNIVWRIRDRYREIRREGGYLYDWAGLASEVRSALATDIRPRLYRHIVIDEGQDLSPEAIRSLVQAAQPDGSVTLFADYAQQIYGQRISWKSCGLRVAKEERFAENYRNTTQIADLALAMAEMPHFKDSPDLVAPTAPTVAGAKPTLARFTDEAHETENVRRQAAELGQYARVAVLARTRAQSRLITKGIPGARVLHDKMSFWDDTPGVYFGTYHSSKGLEFDVVILPFCSATRWPDPDAVGAFGDDEAAARDSRLLYVGVTRARSELLVTYTGELTGLLPDPSSSLWADTG